MTSNPLRLACLAICLQAAFAQAQDADAASRAQRDASNPLRMIIEASKLKPRQKAAEPELAPRAAPEKVVVRPQVAKPAVPPAGPSLAQAAPSNLAPSIALAAAVEPLQPAASAPVEQVPPPAATEVAPQGTSVGPPESPKAATTSLAPDQTPPSALPAVAAIATAATLPPAIVPTSTSTPTFEPRPPVAQAATTQVALAAPSPPQPDPGNAPASAARVPLQLASYVEPLLTDRVRRRLQGEATVVVKFTVNPDGSVADVAVRSSSDRALDPIAIDAVSQWRYKPIAAAQPHAVELVFKTAN